MNQMAHFSIEGEFITDHFRSKVTEGNWRESQEGLLESIIGLNISHATSVLSGRQKFIGLNDVLLVDDDVYTDNSWVNSQYYTYTHNVIFMTNQFFRLVNEVDTFTSRDADIAMVLLGISTIPAKTSDDDFVFAFRKARAETYKQNNETIVVEFIHVWYYYEPTKPDFPGWLTIAEYKDLIKHESIRIKQQLYLKNIRSEVDWTVYQERVDSAIEITEAAKLLEKESISTDKIMAIISEQADKCGGWISETDTDTNITYKIPKNAFLKWCLYNSRMFDSIEWSTINSPNQKMHGDDPNHTDWWMFTGHSLEDSYNNKLPVNHFLAGCDTSTTPNTQIQTLHL